MGDLLEWVDVYCCEECGSGECRAELPVRGSAVVLCHGEGGIEFDLDTIDVQIDGDVLPYVEVVTCCAACGHKQTVCSP